MTRTARVSIDTAAVKPSKAIKDSSEDGATLDCHRPCAA